MASDWFILSRESSNSGVMARVSLLPALGNEVGRISVVSQVGTGNVQLAEKGDCLLRM